MTIRQLTLQEAEFIAHRLAVELMDSRDEPIPPFSTREPGKLESCLAEPFQTFGGKFLHRAFVERAAVLFYLIAKNHCFGNGNKRMAVTLTNVFCFVNKRELRIAPMELYRLANSVAESNPREKDKVQPLLISLFRSSVKPLRPEFRVDKRHYRTTL